MSEQVLQRESVRLKNRIMWKTRDRGGIIHTRGRGARDCR